MTYEEIKERLTSCEIKLKELKDNKESLNGSKNYNTAINKLTMLKESLKRRLKETQQTGVITTDDEKKAAELAKGGMNVKLTQEQEDSEKSTADKIKALIKMDRAANAATALSRKAAFMKGDTKHGKMDPSAKHGNLRVHTSRPMDPIYEQMSEEKYEAFIRLQDIFEELHSLSTEVHQIMRSDFPSEYRRGDAYGAFDFGTSRNRYDTTFEKILEELEDYDGDEESLDEGFDGSTQLEQVIDGIGYDSFEDFFNDNPGGEEAVIRWIFSIKDFRDRLGMDDEDLYEAKTLTYNDFVRMVRDDMMAGAAPDERPSDEQVKNRAKTYYNDYLRGANVDDLFEGQSKFSEYSNNELAAKVRELSKQRADAASSDKSGLVDGLNKEIEGITRELKKRSQKLKNLSRTDIDESGTGDTPISKMSDQELADYIGSSVAKVKSDRAHAEEIATDMASDQMDEIKTDYMKRRERESDYYVSKKDKPARAYKEPKNDYFARRKKEMQEGDVDAQTDGGDLDIGHQDDEPSMIKKDIYDIINYAAKLYKQLDKYDKYDGEVDFPHWWQSKVVKARDYMSAAQHYLESEEKQPAIDQLALEAQSHPVMIQQRIAHAKKAKAKSKEAEGQMAATKGKK